MASQQHVMRHYYQDGYLMLSEKFPSKKKALEWIKKNYFSSFKDSTVWKKFCETGSIKLYGAERFTLRPVKRRVKK